MSSLRGAESIPQTLAGRDGDSEAFSAIESNLNGEHSVQSNFCSSHGTPNGPDKDDSDHLLDNIATFEELKTRFL